MARAVPTNPAERSLPGPRTSPGSLDAGTNWPAFTSLAVSVWSATFLLVTALSLSCLVPTLPGASWVAA